MPRAFRSDLWSNPWGPLRNGAGAAFALADGDAPKLMVAKIFLYTYFRHYVLVMFDVVDER